MIVIADYTLCIYTVLQIFDSRTVQPVETFYAMSQTRTVLRCPLQPGALVSYYYGSWERDGETLVEIPAPNNGNPQDIVRSDTRYDLERATFSLIINSVEPTDADSSYVCILSVFNPAAPLQQFVSLQTDVIRLSLMVNGKKLIKELHWNSVVAMCPCRGVGEGGGRSPMVKCYGTDPDSRNLNTGKVHNNP